MDLVHFVYRRFCTPGCTELELEEHSDIIYEVKLHTEETFDQYQASGMGTSKWLAMEHLADALYHAGGIEYPHGG